MATENKPDRKQKPVGLEMKVSNGLATFKNVAGGKVPKRFAGTWTYSAKLVKDFAEYQAIKESNRGNSNNQETDSADKRPDNGRKRNNRSG